jgi:hypothetical protein
MEILYQLLFAVTTVFTSILLTHSLRRKKYMMVKPSFWFIIFLHIQIQWSSVIYAQEIYARLYYPIDFFILTQIFPLLFLLFSRLTFVRESKSIYSSLKEFKFDVYSNYLARIFRICILLSLIIVSYYLLNIPIGKTGLYEIVFGSDVQLATSAREESLKLANASIRYSYVFFNKTLAVAIGMIVVLHIRNLIRIEERRKIVFPVFLLLLTVFAASFSGARSHGVYVLLGSICPLLFVSKTTINPVKIAVGILLLLSIPVALQLQKFNLDFSFDNIISGYDTIILHRTLSVPMQTGLNWLDYVQKYGYWGISGVSFLQGFTTDSPQAVSNIMMNHYNDRLSVESGLMNTSFIFSYYSYFGRISFLILIPLVLALDCVLYYFKRLPIPLMLLATSSTCLSCINLVNTEFHTIFLSYGFASGFFFYLAIRKLVPFRPPIL